LYDRSLFDAGYVVPRADEKEYWPRINEIINKEKVKGAVILPEKEVLEWAQNKHRLKQNVVTHLPDYNLASTLVNKHKLHEYLDGSALIPKFRKINIASYNYDALAEELGNIFWVRSTEGSSGLGSLKIESELALSQWISINPEVREFIATEYLSGQNMACKKLYFDGRS